MISCIRGAQPRSKESRKGCDCSCEASNSVREKWNVTVKLYKTYRSDMRQMGRYEESNFTMGDQFAYGLLKEPYRCHFESIGWTTFLQEEESERLTLLANKKDGRCTYSYAVETRACVGASKKLHKKAQEETQFDTHHINYYD